VAGHERARSVATEVSRVSVTSGRLDLGLPPDRRRLGAGRTAVRGGHRPLAIDGLWGIGFGFGNANSGPLTSLYFAAGPDGEHHGLFGSIVSN